MPIYRFSAQEIRGVVLNEDPERAMQIVATPERLAAFVGRAVTRHGLMPVECRPGMVEVTPTYWRRATNRHILEVLPDGEHGIYRAIPCGSGAAPAALEPVPGGRALREIEGVRSLRLPDEVLSVPLFGPIAGDPRFRLHELVFHASQPMPQPRY